MNFSIKRIMNDITIHHITISPYQVDPDMATVYLITQDTLM